MTDYPVHQGHGLSVCHAENDNTFAQHPLTTYTIITCQPNAVLATIHNWMPVILLPEDEDAWLDPDMTEVEAITSYLRPYPDELLEAVRVA